ITVRVADPDGGVGVRTFDVKVSGSAALTLPFTDGFNGGDNSFLGSVWNDRVVGNFDILSGAAQSTAAVSVATLRGVTEVDVSVAADIALRPRSGQLATLIARYQPAGVQTMYHGGVYAAPNGTYTANIYRSVNGVNTLLVSRPVATGTGALRFEAVGNSLKLFLNGTLLAFAYDGTIAAGGTVGFRGSVAGTRFDNFDADTVTLSDPNATVPFTDDFGTAVNQQLSRNWVERSGNVRVANGVATNNAAVTVALLNPQLVSFNDAVLSATLTTTATNQFAGLIGRSNFAGTSYYQAGLLRTGNTVTAVIQRVTNGVATTLGSAAFGPASGELKFEMVGSVLNLKRVSGMADVLLLSVSDGTFTSGGFGLKGVGAVTWDNFSFTATA
ncbi:MAG: hypothetical protein ACRC33_13090, partial [Gemmataceae bacterium]